MTLATHTPVSNGALISTYDAADPGPHTLIVAGQHGNETGPIDALAGYSARVGRGTVTLIRLANPWAHALGRRRYFTGQIVGSNPGFGQDMNRQWCTDPLNREIWAKVCEVAGRLPDRVFDLHSARRPWWAGESSAYRGREALAADERSLNDAGRILAVPEDRWRARVYDHPDGSLAKFAASRGCVGVTVEFDETTAIDAPVIGGEPTGFDGLDVKEGIRRKTRHERTIGVLAAVRAILAPHAVE